MEQSSPVLQVPSQINRGKINLLRINKRDKRCQSDYNQENLQAALSHRLLLIVIPVFFLFLVVDNLLYLFRKFVGVKIFFYKIIISSQFQAAVSAVFIA